MKNAKSSILQKLKNTYCRVMSSTIEGVGVFAIRDIPVGIDPFEGVRESKSYPFHSSELVDLDPEVKKMIQDFFVMDKEGCYWIPEEGLHEMEMGAFVNHSETPNLVTHDGSETFISARDIKKGEELTVSYDTFDYQSPRKKTY